jgi:MFS family permease
MDSREQIVLWSAMLVTFVTGSIHAFSVFLVPLESLLQLPRAQISLFYSFALVFLTGSVLFGYLIYPRIKPSAMVFLACSGAGIGLLLSAYGSTWLQIFFGYSVLFGTANGVAYGYVLQLSGRALARYRGFAMAAVTAAYAAGSVVFSLVLAGITSAHSIAAAFTIMGGILIATGALSGLMLKKTGVAWSSQSESPSSTRHDKSSPGQMVLLWFAYGCAVFAGLMAIGHAAGIIQSLENSYALATWGAVFIGIGSAIGGFFIGAVITTGNMVKWLVGLPLLSAFFLGTLTVVHQPLIAIALLSFTGFAYGAVIAVYPFAVNEIFGARLGPKIYGRVFTAWGFAGLAGPWTAGKLFDEFSTYNLALITAAVIAIASSLAIAAAIGKFSSR